MKLFQKLKGKLGFTLAELIVVVAILTIVTAVAVPSTASYVKRINLTELDDSARSIYMAAQSRLDDLKAKGTSLDSYDGTALADFYDSEGAVKYISYTRNSGSDEFMKSINNVSLVESEIDNNYYIIEYDPVTWIVYSAFYSEDDFISEYNSGTFSEAESRAFSERLKNTPTIGYYGNEVYVAPEKKTDVPTPKITSFNKEKMGITIEVGDIESSVTNILVTIGDGTNTVEIVDGIISQNSKVTFILDTLTDSVAGDLSVDLSGRTFEQSFEKWADGKIAPGSDITITVTCYSSDGKGVPQTKTVTINSLFESVSYDSVNACYIANVSYGRHLQNLNNADIKVGAVNINKDIDFSSTDGDYEGWKAYYSNFKAITADKAQNIKAVTGYNHKLSNAVISGGGFFEALNGAAVQSLSLVNATVSGGVNAGALAGTMTGGSITNVEVYVEGNDWTDPTSDPYAKYTISGFGSVGGLVGVADGTAISNSYASVKVTGSYAGGLVGESKNTVELSNVYSGGHTYGGVYKSDTVTLINVSGTNGAGGIVGNVTGTVTVKGTVYSTCSVGGASGRADTAFNVTGGSLDTASGTCYAVGTVYDNNSKEEIATKSIHTGNVLSADDEGIVVEAGLKVPTYTYDTSIKTSYPYKGVTFGSSLHRGDWVKDDTKQTVSLGFFYWEKEGGDYKFHEYYTVYEEDGTVISDNRTTLCKDKEDAEAITEYGYGYYFTGDVEVDEKDFVLEDDADSARAAAVKYIFGEDFEGEYTLVIGKGRPANNAYKNDDKFTFTVKSDNDKKYIFFYNPDFYAISDINVDFGKSEANAYKVRTVAQLQHVDSYLSGGIYFWQDHDIVASSEGGNSITPIGKDANNAFKGNYNGRSYRIINIQIDGTGRNYVGLFGVTEDAVLENIIMFVPAASEFANGNTHTISVSGNGGYVGGIVGWAKVADSTSTVSAPVSGPIINVSYSAETGLKVGSLGLSGGKARVVNAYNSLYAKTAALGASTGAKVRALSVSVNSTTWRYSKDYVFNSAKSSEDISLPDFIKYALDAPHDGLHRGNVKVSISISNFSSSGWGSISVNIKNDNDIYWENYNQSLLNANNSNASLDLSGSEFAQVLPNNGNGILGNFRISGNYNGGTVSATVTLTVSICNEGFCSHENITLISKGDENGHNARCNDCGEEVVLDHSYGADYESDYYNHWKKCTLCDYESASVSHEYDNWPWDSDDYVHWHPCKICGGRASVGQHTPGGGTKDENGIHYIQCSVCVNYYPEVSCDHEYDGWTFDSASHWHHCTSVCGNDFDKAEHKFEYTINTDGTHTAKCTTCGYETKAVHKYELKAIDDDYHGGTCICGDVQAASLHDWDIINATNKKCKTCGHFVGDHEHKCEKFEKNGLYAAINDNHWYNADECWLQCDLCGEHYNIVKHEPGTVSYQSADAGCTLSHSGRHGNITVPHNYVIKANDKQHWLECSNCGFVYKGEHPILQKTAQGTQPYTDHKWDSVDHNFCLECGWSKTNAWTDKCLHESGNNAPTHLDETYHSYVCSKCGEYVKEEHGFSYTYNNSTHDVSCECGYSAPSVAHTIEWLHDNTVNQHWQGCSVCGYEVSGTRGGHNLKWHSDDDTAVHYEYCSNCGYTVNRSRHEWTESEVKNPTGAQAGYAKYTCKCGKTKTVEIPKLGVCGVCGGELEDYNNRVEEGHWLRCKNHPNDHPTVLQAHTMSAKGNGTSVSGLKNGEHFHYCAYCGYHMLQTFEEVQYTIMCDDIGYADHTEQCDGPHRNNAEYESHKHSKAHHYYCNICGNDIGSEQHDGGVNGEEFCTLCGMGFPNHNTPSKVTYTGPGKIENCAVVGYVISDATTGGDTYLGGIAGKSDVPIKCCEAVVDIKAENITSGTANYGGIVGETSHNVSECYSGGKLNTDKTHGQNNLGLIYGNATDSTASFDGCYSYMKHDTFGSGNSNIVFTDSNAAPTVNKTPRTYVTSATENRTDYPYEPKIYDAKVGLSDKEHYGYFK